MSTSSFGQSPVFGAAPPAVQAAPAEPPPARSNKTVVIAVAAGVVALGVLGGAAALVLGSSDAGTDVALPPGAVAAVEPSVAPSTPEAPLPTSVVQGRNVFLPLVDPAGDAAAAAIAAPPAPPPAPAPTAAPTAAPVPIPITVSIPLPAVTRTVEVPGPTVTTPGPTVSTPGPTVTTPGPTETLDPFAYYVSAVQVTDPDPAAPGSTADFMVNGQLVTVQEGEVFLDFFRYLGYSDAAPPETGATVRFVFGSDMWSVPTGRVIGLGPR